MIFQYQFYQDKEFPWKNVFNNLKNRKISFLTSINPNPIISSSDSSGTRGVEMEIELGSVKRKVIDLKQRLTNFEREQKSSQSDMQ